MFSFFLRDIPNPKPSRIERIESFKAPLAIIDRLRPYGKGSSFESFIISSMISRLDQEIAAFNSAKISSIDNNHDILELSCKLLSITGHEARPPFEPEPKRLFNILSNLLSTQEERCKLIEEQQKTFIFGLFDKKQANAEVVTSLKTFNENEIFDKVLVKEIFKFM